MKTQSTFLVLLQSYLYKIINMKKRILLLPLLMLALVTSGQVVSNCQTTYLDTLKYIDQVKTSSWTAIPVNVINDGGAYGYAGFGQRFEAPDSVKVLGFSFRGFVFSGASDTVVCRLYEANGSGLPGVQIDSVIHTVPLVSGFTGPLDSDLIKNTVMFGSGHLLEGDYIVTVENFSSSDIYLVRNTDGDGLGEDLCLSYYRGLSDASFDAWYSIFSFGAGWNFDMPFEPIVEYSFSSELTISADSICGSDTLILFDTIVSFDDSVLYNRMYNPNFSSYNGYNTSVNYNYGDGISDSTGVHLYSGSGNFVVSVLDTILVSGWTNNSFVSTCSGVVFVEPGASFGPDTSVCMQSSMVLSPGVFDTYSWNTGQLNDSIIVGPILNPGLITYTVDVTSASCNSTASITITFENCIGIEANTNHRLSVYPNPVNDNFTINTDFTQPSVIKIYDNQGKIVLVQKIIGTVENINVSGLQQGVYILAISNGNQVVRKKLQILR